MTAKGIGIGAGVALLACWLAGACESSGGGSTCFPPAQGPADTACAGFDLGLVCPVDLTPWYTCTCTAGAAADAGAAASAQTWVCAPADATGTGGATGSGGMGTGSGGMGTGGGMGGSGGTGDAGAE